MTKLRNCHREEDYDNSKLTPKDMVRLLRKNVATGSSHGSSQKALGIESEDYLAITYPKLA